ncbi:cytochrome c biogenesis CcdA family protein [Chloroflexota bacterium]
MPFENVSFAIAFSAGFASFLSPCVLPLVPAYIAHLAGSSVVAPGAQRRGITLLYSLCFVLGFSLVFVALGASGGYIGSAVSGYMPLLRKIGGAVLILLGIYLAVAPYLSGKVNLSFLYWEKRLGYTGSAAPGYLRSFLVGVVFAVAWTPCVGPVLAGIFGLAVTSETAWKGAYLLAAYSMGLGIPFLIAAVAIDPVTGLMRRINRYLNIVSIASGALLIAIGVLILSDTMIKLSQYLDFFGSGA